MSIRSILAAGLAAAIVGLAAPATTQNLTSSFKTKQTPTLLPGQSAWVHFFFEGAKDPITDFKMSLVAPNGYTVDYPSAGTYTSFYRDSTLDPNEVDYAAVRIGVPATERQNQRAVVVVTCKVGGKPYLWFGSTLIKVKVNKGDDFAVLTTEVGPLAADSDTWVHVDFQGLAPQLGDFQVRVTDAKGLGVTYPGSRNYSGLYGDSTLNAGELDYSALKLDTTGMPAGKYTIELEVTYTGGAALQSSMQPVQLAVEVGGRDALSTSGALWSDRQRLDRSDTRATFVLDAGQAEAGRSYALFGSMTGVAPGVRVGPHTLPLVVDGYTLLTARMPAAVLRNARGTLDASGRALATFTLPPSVVAALDRVTIYHAYVVFDTASVSLASDWAPLLVVDE